MDTILVMAAIGDNALELKKIVLSLATVALIAYLAIKVIRDDNRSAWSAIPLVAVILILATSNGAAWIRDTGLGLLQLIFGG